MRVRLTTDRATAHGIERAGEVLDLPRASALRLVAAGQAVELAEVETAALAGGTRKAVTRRRAPRRRDPAPS